MVHLHLPFSAKLLLIVYGSMLAAVTYLLTINISLYTAIVQLLTALTPVAILVLAWVQRLAAKKASAAAASAAKAAELVKSTLADSQKAQDQTLATIVDTGEKVHALVNSSMGISLMNTVFATKANSISLHRIADLTNNSSDLELAKIGDQAVVEAERKLEEHKRKQDKVDSMA